MTRRSWNGAKGYGGYKRWEANILELCGYEYKDKEWVKTK